ncbi:MAG: SCO family protein [Limimaricola sp.]|uniref:SCO family protein n=1 Tax=Limimaricola sp. TaxID=2211665 RepID=UPI001D4205C9|nr:SCO family protein [Limimaricola sp.]MBI1416542.1 SCO family protein [Limimaricola sp.]
MPRALRLALVGLSLLLVILVGARLLLFPALNTSIADTFGQGDYRLETTDGKPFTFDSLKGAPSAVYFGYTHCPDVCPTTLGDILTWQEALGENGKQLRVFFITVDPERDSLAMLKSYVSWVPGVVGVSGSSEEIAKAIRAFRVYAQKVPGTGGDYGMDHTATLFLFDAQGRLFEPIGYGEGDTRALAKLKRLLG